MALSDGLEIWQCLEDLRHIKLPKDVRAKVVYLDEEYKSRGLTPAETSWVRRLYNRRGPQLAVLHQSYKDARETDARIRRGSGQDKLLRLRAKRLTRKRLEEKKAKLEAELREHEAEEKDFGI